MASSQFKMKFQYDPQGKSQSDQGYANQKAEQYRIVKSYADQQGITPEEYQRREKAQSADRAARKR